MNKTATIILLAIAGLVVGGGFVYFGMNTMQSDKSITPTPIATSDSDADKDEEDEISEDNDQDAALLAGDTSPYFEFSQSAYDAAIADGNIVFLEFYADWCPICRVEQKDIVEGFDSLDREDVIGFRANFKDDETDDQERKLAKELGVTYQHTKFIFVDGEEVLRSGDPWDTSRFLEAIETAKSEQ